MELAVLWILLGLMTSLEGHSWIACTDYLEYTGDYWDANKCRAYPRHGHQYTQKDSFGQDRGYNIINPPENAPCRTDRDDNGAYTDAYPKAVYYRGQTVVIAHPTKSGRKRFFNPPSAYMIEYAMSKELRLFDIICLGGAVVTYSPPTSALTSFLGPDLHVRQVAIYLLKNHVADVGCTNKYIPDNGNFIWAGPKNGQSDVSLTTFRQTILADLGIGPNGHETPDGLTRQYPKAGYMNAPKFCDDTDKSLATNMFVIPEDMEAGSYTLMWGWYFNSPMDLYTSCWEVDIVNTKDERNARLIALGLSTEDPTNTDNNPTPTPAPPGSTPSPSTPARPGSTTTDDTTDSQCRPCVCDISLASGLQTGVFLMVTMVTAAIVIPK